MKNKNIVIIILGLILTAGVLFFFNFQSQQSPKLVEKPTVTETEKKDEKTSMANPASVNCEEKGGKLTIEEKPSGGEYGVCVFEDNKQCEEWALFRGECPVGGIKVTGYTTDAQKYCAITGGSFIPDKEKTGTEKGTCKLSDGTVCDDQDYYEGTCSRKAELQKDLNPSPIKAIFTCKDEKSIEAVFAGSKVSLVLSDGRKLELDQTLAASGARYANKDETLVFWNKGNTAFIEEKEKTTYSDCLQK